LIVSIIEPVRKWKCKPSMQEQRFISIIQEVLTKSQLFKHTKLAWR